MLRQLTVLGGCGAWPEAGRACSGFLVEYDGFRLVVDLGYATLPRLLTLVPDGRVDAVVITHEHPDHCVDLHALYRVWRFARPPMPGRLPVYAPDGVLTRLGALDADGEDALRAVLDHTPLPAPEPGAPELPAPALAVGPFRLESIALPHWVPNAGVRLSTGSAGEPGEDRCVLAYTGDTGPDPALARLGRDADLFVVEATLQGDPPADGPRFLMTAREAGRAAAAAGARRLLLTHFWPGSDRSVSVAQARESFAGEILVADEGLRIAL